jgi:hypothetical protein
MSWLWGLDLEIVYAQLRTWNTHLLGISHVMHNYNNFHAQMESVAGPKQKILHRIQNSATKRTLPVIKDFWRLTPSKRSSSQNMGVVWKKVGY